MKRFFICTMIASLATLMSCNNDEVMDLEPVNGKKVTVTANIDGTSATRVALTPDKTNPAQPTIKVDWEASGETFKAYAADKTEPIVFTQTADTEDSPNLFEAILPELAASYTVIYGDKDFAAQNGTLNQNSCVLMQATVTDNFASAIDFEHQTAILKPSFKIGNAALDNKAITQITMGGIKQPTADTATGFINVTPSALNDIYIFLPAYEVYNGPHTFSFAVTADDEAYEATLTIPEGKSIEAGKFYTADITLKSVPYVTFTADTEQTLTMLTYNYSLDDKFQFSVGSGEWKTVVASEAISFGGAELGNLRLRGKSCTGTADDDYEYSYIKFGNDTPVACTGDIRTLMDWENHATVKTDDARFFGLFDNCEQLTTAPALPATTLATYCYKYMFSGCKALTAGPALPATTLAQSCYSNMFSGCTALTAGPALPATTLAQSCYSNMFSGCTALQTAPTLPATTLADYCYNYMFSGCTALETAPELLATTLQYSCYSGMFKGCTALTAAPELPATTLATNCYYYMFSDCTSLQTAPALPATTLAEQCYFYMFNYCTALTVAPALPATTLAKACYYYMFNHCEKLTTSPELKAKKSGLQDNCYQGMFNKCIALNKITILVTDFEFDAAYYFKGWVNGVAQSGTFITNGKTKLSLLRVENKEQGNGIPQGWDVVIR